MAHVENTQCLPITNRRGVGVSTHWGLRPLASANFLECPIQTYVFRWHPQNSNQPFRNNILLWHFCQRPIKFFSFPYHSQSHQRAPNWNKWQETGFPEFAWSIVSNKHLRRPPGTTGRLLSGYGHHNACAQCTTPQQIDRPLMPSYDRP